MSEDYSESDEDWSDEDDQQRSGGVAKPPPPPNTAPPGFPSERPSGVTVGNITVGGPPLTVLGQDFILVGVKDKVVHVGDQLSVWVGDGTWMNVALDLLVTCTDTDTYINMAPR